MNSASFYRLFLLIAILASAPTGFCESLIDVKLQSRFGVVPGGTVDVSIIMGSSEQLGGIDFTIGYEDSIFDFVSVAQDTGLKHWEYFYSAYSPIEGTVRIVSIADIDNGPIHPDSADYYPRGSIARFRFSVMPTWTTDSSQVPFTFHWGSCQDNATSDRTGFRLFVVSNVYDASGQILWDETDNTAYPESLRIPNVGLPDSCIQTRTPPLYNIDFHFGAAANYIFCGNADANSMVNISDATYLIAYVFGEGPAPEPVLAGDVDCNSMVNISDAVYLVAYIFSGGPAPCAGC